MDYIALAIPFFFLFIGIELLAGRARGRRDYRLNDSVSDLSCGVVEQVLKLFLAGAIGATYVYLYDHQALWHVRSSALSWAVLFVAVDLCYYWFHRVSHEVNCLWAIHVVHHQSEEYNLSVALRQAAFQPAVSWVFYLPLAVFGFPPLMCFTMQAINTLCQFWIHTRLIGRLGPLEWVLNTPSHHRVHHGSDKKYIDRNHGGALIVWDRLFGTFQQEEEEPTYGVTRPLGSFNPLWANLHAFADLFAEARRLPRLRDRIRIWFMPPGWYPPDAQPDKTTARDGKYDVRVTRGTRAYVLLQFVPALLATTVLLFFARKMPPWQDAALAGGIALTLLCLGGLLEGRRWALSLESARVLGLLAVALSACDSGDLSPPDAGAPDGAINPDLALPPPRYDWVGVIGTGQSLSVGAVSGGYLSTTQPFHNLKLLDTGPDPKYPLDGGGVLSLVPLIEPIRPMLAGYADNQYPNNIYGETPHSGMANQITALYQAAGGQDYVTLHSVVGWSGHCLVDIDKQGTGRAYPGSLSEARTFKKMAGAAGKTLGYGAIILTHGECDSANAMYGAGLYQLFMDYNADLKAVTGQAEDVPLLVSQQSTVPGGPGLSQSTLAVWQQGVQHPGQIICVGPKYQYVYAADHLHLPAAGYVRLGEKYAEVFYQAVVLGRPWKPLQPRTITRAGAVITVEFDVPVPPLAWEETLSRPHQAQNVQWANGRGFEVSDQTGPLTITAVAIAGDAVQIQLDKVPTGQGLMVGYAMTQDDAGYQGGLDGGRHGQLRDSDPLVGQDQQTIMCKVTSGSATVGSGSAFGARTPRDLVSGDGLPDGTIVTAVAAPDQLTLSQVWSGPSGTVPLSFHYDQRNYAVQFEMAVP